MNIIEENIIYKINPEYNKEMVNQIVDIHMKTFEGFFLTFLGKGFLKHLYKGFLKHNLSGMIVAQYEGNVVAFLAYSENLSGFYKYLIKKSLLPFAWYGMCAVIRKPIYIVRLLRAFLKPGESRRAEKYIELSSIGVDPEYKKHHIGSQLISKLKGMFCKKEFEYIKLETDAKDNDIANEFYIKNDFVLANSYFTYEGRKMNEYRWKTAN